ncbi:MAG TPA: ABC transporter ATP-binding protein [Burkholderiales bacterium]|nr:ABC transporter ATP-binding protein [Burkholderiales bacterium]
MADAPLSPLLSPLLSLTGVHTHIEHYHILQGVDFAVPKGELTMLLGRNGAGKTTALRTILGLWRASSGSIRFEGRELTPLDTPAIAALGIAYVPESMGIFAGLTVRENLLLAARSGPLSEERLEWIFRFFPPMKKFWELPAGNLSGGQKQMLAISRAVVEPRKLVLIDEPTKGLAPAIIHNLVEALGELKRTGTTILMVEQNFHAARSLGDSVAVMDAGRIVHTGRMANLAADEALQTRLLGLSLEAHQ